MKHENLSEALAAAQAEMSHAAFDKENPFYNNSGYASLPSVIEAAKPFAKHGIAFLQHSRPQEKSVGIETVLYGYGEQIGTGVVTVPMDKPNAHGMASAMTYARRYSLSMALGIGSEKDDDGNEAQGKPNRPKGVAADALEQTSNEFKIDDNQAAAYASALTESINNQDTQGYQQLMHEIRELKDPGTVQIQIGSMMIAQERKAWDELEKRIAEKKAEEAKVDGAVAEIAQAKKVKA